MTGDRTLDTNYQAARAALSAHDTHNALRYLNAYADRLEQLGLLDPFISTLDIILEVTRLHEQRLLAATTPRHHA